MLCVTIEPNLHLYTHTNTYKSYYLYTQICTHMQVYVCIYLAEGEEIN